MPDQNVVPDGDVQLRRIPHPYSAMLAVCSDLDETPDRHVYWETTRFLNATEPTAMGPGAGLEVGNSIYFDMPGEQFSYWNTDDAGREMVRTLIRSGHIDCLHSYGDLACTRRHAARALEELARHDCRLEVWTDHGTAATNFGSDIMAGHGDEPGHEAYHADLTLQQGVQYVWRGRVTSVIGQDVRARLEEIFSPRHPVASARTLAKEAAKNVLRRCGSGKYAMHNPNHVLRPSTLRDGSAVQEFLRSNPHWRGVSSCETAGGIAEVLTATMLRRLIRREGVCILYTHLGKVRNVRIPFAEPTVACFRRLAQYYHQGRILVTTTRRALRYLAARDLLTWSAHRQGNLVTIDVQLRGSDKSSAPAVHREDLMGMTFEVPQGSRGRITIDGDPVDSAQVNPGDHGGLSTVSLPWRALEFPRMEW